MISESSIESVAPGYSPEEAALLMRLRVFVTMRWIAILGMLVATLVASQVLDISFPTLPVYLICPVIALYNVVFYFQLRAIAGGEPGTIVHKARMYGNVHIFLDLIALTVLLHFTGGIENPLVFFYVFHIVLASIALHFRVVYVVATGALMMVGLLVGLEYAKVIPHVNLEGFAAPTLYQDGVYILAVLLALAAILYGTTYMATAISGELRKRQRQVVQLGEELLAEKKDELEQVSREKAELTEEKDRFLQFLSIAAHDLKAPLTAIQGFLWVMVGGYAGELTDKQKNMLERSSKRITELLNLISDLLDIPRIETGQILTEMKDVSLKQILRNCLQEQRKVAKEKGLKLTVEIPEQLQRIRGSGPRLQQVITNLVDNAIQYTPEGTITVSVKERRDDIQVEIRDTGIGIPEEDMPHLFDDFFRASNVEVKGTGLGLSISKRIIEAHNGEIWCESPCPETSQGSRFTFTLPKMRKRSRRQR
ncbi:MAG TPA: HAMP domain-containing histidine kinase [Dehalococcoidia bacterium]|nr:HAMP domain-containing histidine kinase [Dehalococcoidia bacterium]